jgi:hypothetical protein
MGPSYGRNDFMNLDAAQDVNERHRRDRDDSEAQEEADPIPGEPFVADSRAYSKYVERRRAPARLLQRHFFHVNFVAMPCSLQCRGSDSPHGIESRGSSS